MRFAPQTLVARLRAHPALRRSLLILAVCACILVVVGDALAYREQMFPTQHIRYMVPANWTSTPYRGGADLARSWWQVEYGVTLTSPDLVLVRSSICGLGKCLEWPVNAAWVGISDYGAGGYTNLQEWEQAWENQTISARMLFRYQDTFLAGQPAYCVYIDWSLRLDKLVVGVPTEVFKGSCFIRWGDRVYQISASLSETATRQQYDDDLNTLLHILRNIRFI